MLEKLPQEETMYQAFMDKNTAYEGIFFVAVKTTGIFCRPTCTARKPKRENVEFLPSSHEALCRGYRPCKICKPLLPLGANPDWLNRILAEVDSRSDKRLKDAEIREMGIDPNKIRRWFKKNHGLTFQGYLRTLRIGQAFGRIKYGEKVHESAYGSGYESLSGFNDSFKKTTGFSPKKSKERQLVFINRILTPLGPMLAGAGEKGICLLEFVDRRMLETQFKRLRKYLNAEFIAGESIYFAQLNSELGEYFAGKRKTFSVPLEIVGTPFQKKVWSALCEIPYGKTRSYKEQAEMIGNPKAVRAVGTANGDNKIAILIPCHRVVGSNEDLTGYGGGLWRKKYLLDLEAAHAE